MDAIKQALKPGGFYSVQAQGLAFEGHRMRKITRRIRQMFPGGIGSGALCVCAFLVVPPEWGFALLAPPGVATYLPMGVTIAFARLLMPHNQGLAGSITLGLSWFIASFSVYPISVLGEWFGLANVFWVLPGSFVAAGVFACFLLEVR